MSVAALSRLDTACGFNDPHDRGYASRKGSPLGKPKFTMADFGLLSRRVLLIVWIGVLLLGTHSRAEVADGPANVRAVPGGAILFSLKDGEPIKVLSEEAGCLLIEWIVEQPAHTLEGDRIRPHQALFDFGGYPYRGRSCNYAFRPQGVVRDSRDVSDTIEYA